MSAVSQITAKQEERFALSQALERTLDVAERAGRDLSPMEARRWDADEARVRELDREIAEMERALPARLQANPALRSLLTTGERGADGAGHYPPMEKHGLGRWLSGELRALSTASNSAGALVPSEWLPFVWDLLAASSVGIASGITVIPTERATLHIPSRTADAAAAWTAEGAAISPTDQTFADVVVTPTKCAVLQQLTNEVINDSEPAVLQTSMVSLMRSLALALDLAIYQGSGSSNQPTGLNNVSGISTVSMGTNGAALTNLDPIADAIATLESNNANADSIVMHPRSWQEILKLKTTTNAYLLEGEDAGPTGAPNRSIFGVPVYLSSQLATNETQGTSNAASSVYVYQADQVILVRRQDVAVELDRSRLFNTDSSELRGIVRAGVAVPNAKAVCRIVGVL